MKDQLDQFKGILQKKGLRVTQSRLAVFNVLERNKSNFLTAEEIFDKISKSSKYQCDRASVYRVLNTFSEIGIVNVGHFQGEASKYQIHHHGVECESCDDKHDHYFRCIVCNTIESIGECFVGAKIKELEEKGFKTLSHHLEISGHCPACR